MPPSGGAIQPANLPGSVTRCIRLPTKAAILLGRQPIVLPGPPFFGGDGLALRIGMDAGPGADRAPEARARQSEPEIVAGFLDQPVPALDADLAIFDVGRARHLVHRAAHRHLFRDYATLSVGQIDAQPARAEMIVEARLVRAALDAGREIARRIG